MLKKILKKSKKKEKTANSICPKIATKKDELCIVRTRGRQCSLPKDHKSMHHSHSSEGKCLNKWKRR